MKKTISKTEAKKQIDDFFKIIKNKTPKEIKKIKRLAMAYNIPLKSKRKKFCEKCLVPYQNPKIRIKKDIKSVTCENCENITRYKLK